MSHPAPALPHDRLLRIMGAGLFFHRLWSRQPLPGGSGDGGWGRRTGRSGRCWVGIRNRESDILRACLDLLALAGIPAARLNAGTISTGKYRVRLAPAGWPDIVGCLPRRPDCMGGDPCNRNCGRFLGVEVKRKNGRVRPAQKAWMSEIQAIGAVVLLIRDVKELEAWLKEGGYIR